MSIPQLVDVRIEEPEEGVSCAVRVMTKVLVDKAGYVSIEQQYGDGPRQVVILGKLRFDWLRRQLTKAKRMLGMAF